MHETNRSRSRGLWVLALLLAAGCVGNRPISRSNAEKIERVAVVVRLIAPPLSYVGRGDPDATEDAFGRGPDESDARLETHLANAVSPFEMEELFRAGFSRELGQYPGWRVMPPLQVASALGSLLAREEPPDFDKLSGIGADAAFDVTITGWGVWDEGDDEDEFAGFWVEAEARLLRLPEEKEIWHGQVEVNGSTLGDPRLHLDLTEVAAAPRETLRRGLAPAVDRAAVALAEALGIERYADRP